MLDDFKEFYGELKQKLKKLICTVVLIVLAGPVCIFISICLFVSAIRNPKYRDRITVFHSLLTNWEAAGTRSFFQGLPASASLTATPVGGGNVRSFSASTFSTSIDDDDRKYLRKYFDYEATSITSVQLASSSGLYSNTVTPKSLSVSVGNATKRITVGGGMSESYLFVPKLRCTIPAGTNDRPAGGTIYSGGILPQSDETFTDCTCTYSNLAYSTYIDGSPTYICPVSLTRKSSVTAALSFGDSGRTYSSIDISDGEGGIAMWEATPNGLTQFGLFNDATTTGSFSCMDEFQRAAYSTTVVCASGDHADQFVVRLRHELDPEFYYGSGLGVTPGQKAATGFVFLFIGLLLTSCVVGIVYCIVKIFRPQQKAARAQGQPAPAFSMQYVRNAPQYVTVPGFHRPPTAAAPPPPPVVRGPAPPPAHHGPPRRAW